MNDVITIKVEMGENISYVVKIREILTKSMFCCPNSLSVFKSLIVRFCLYTCHWTFCSKLFLQ